MLSIRTAVLALALSQCQAGDGDSAIKFFGVRKDVYFTTNENRKIKCSCSINLVYDEKTVFIKNQGQTIPEEMARAGKKGGKKGKAKKPIIKPQVNTTKPKDDRSSRVACGLCGKWEVGEGKVSGKADNFEIHIPSNSNARTRTIISLDITTNPHSGDDFIRNASVRNVELFSPLSGQEMIDQLNLKSKIDKLENLTPEDKADLNKLMQGSIFTFVKVENEASLRRFKKRFIQFNNKTDQLGLNARLFTLLQAEANKFKKKHKESEKIEDINQLIDDLSENCQGGFDGTDDSNVTCDLCDKYRRIDGFCNNLQNKQFGAAGIAMRRLLPNAYQDGFSSPRGGFISNLPSPRKISVDLHHHPAFPSTGPFHSTPGTPLTSKGFTHMAMQFGQFLDHDITLSAQQELDCCDSDFLGMDFFVDPILRRCFNIDIGGDPFYESKGIGCHSFTRSDFICMDDDVREQINGITSFIDASNVYGSDETRASALRLNDGTGKLKDNQNEDPGHLPTRAQCGLPDTGLPNSHQDLVAGDVRANVQPTLVSIHTLFLGEHNRIVTLLKQEADSRTDSFLTGLSNTQKDDILYEEARKIVGATLQNIVYEEYVPLILGSEEVASQGLAILGSSVYDDHVDPSVLNEFATVAYRFGHSLIDGIFNRPVSPWQLRRHYFDNFGFSLNNEWKKEMDGIVQQECPARDLPCTHDITNFLFFDHNTSPAGDDLIARNIQRGRDHGIPSYRKMREFCGLSPLSETPPIPPPEINTTVWNKIINAYSNPIFLVDDIDAFTGGLAEEAPADGLVGPTFACIIGRQFKRLMSGDRFFFTHKTGSDHVRGLLPKSKETVRKRTLGDVICDNVNITCAACQKTPVLHVMKELSESNPHMKCEDREPLDISGIVDDIEAFNPCGTTTETKSTSTTTKTTSSSPTTEEIFKPLPGYCATKSSEIVDYDQEWNDGCRDLNGNLYAKDQFLVSCCGCFKIICNSTEPSATSRHIGDNIFFWNKTLEPQCCQDCHGKVFPAGSVMDTEILNDTCSTEVTTKCVFLGQENRAISEMSYTYQKCCSDERGFHPIGTSVEVPKTCSKRTCDREDGQIYSAWTTKQVVAGCNCCSLPPVCSEPNITCSVKEGTLVEDGGILVVESGYPNKPKQFKCCEGKFLEENSEFVIISQG